MPTWTFCGDESRRRRGCDVDIQWRRVAATPRLRRGYSVEISRGDAAAVRRGCSVEASRGDAAAATRKVRGDESRRRRGCDVDIPWGRVPATPRRRRERLRYDEGTECCDVDAFLPETEKVAAYGAYADCAPPLEFVLRAGDALFIPQFWFHAVRSLDVSISVNAFFSTARDMVRRAPRRALAEFAHNRLGFWRGNCVCHGRRRDNER